MPTDHARAAALQAAIFNSPNFSSIATDAEGVIQVFNVGAERMLGYAAAEMTNKVTPADISDQTELIARANALSVEFTTPIAPGFEALVFKASRGIEDIYELTYVRRDGSRFPAVVSVTALRDEMGAIIGYLLIGTDNTARKQVEEERARLDQRLRDQQLYTRSLIESNADALMTTDPQGVIMDVNRQTELLTGCTRDQLIGAPFREYFTDPIGAAAGIAQVLRDGKVNDYELTARALDGALTPVSINGTTFNDRDDRLQGVFVAARDVTERKRFEATLHLKNAELEEASRMKSEFLANMSHELRTPLNAIIGFSEVLRDGLVGDLSDKQRGFISDIYGSGNHLLALINDILDLSKVEAGKMSLDLDVVEGSSLFSNSMSIIREKAAARRIRLHLDATDALGAIAVDARKVKQIVYNLLSNALKFTPEGGRVTMRTAVVGRSEVGRQRAKWPQRKLQKPVVDSEQFLEFSVSDTGIGIDELGMQRLFRPFSQIDSGLSRKFEGTGLGLAMVKLLAELHGGTAAVESAVGQGSCFTVWLPLRLDVTSAVESVPPHVDVSPPPLDRKALRTALVLDDDPKSAELIALLLQTEGFVALHAGSAEAALTMAEHHPPDLITVDIMLPLMDGWEFIERLRHRPALASVPLVIVSIVADRHRGFALGAAAVLQKPVSRQQLFDALAGAGLIHPAPAAGPCVLVVDEDPVSTERTADQLQGLAARVLTANRGCDALEVTRRERPDVILLDLMVRDPDGVKVALELRDDDNTAHTPIVIVTDPELDEAGRARLSGHVAAIVEGSPLDSERLRAEVRRAVARPPKVL
jgi:PAS domain S-box-containing protein